MDKKTTILLGLGGAALIGGIIYYFRAKNKYQTDVITSLKIDLQNIANQPIKIPSVFGTPKKSGTPPPPAPIKTQTGFGPRANPNSPFQPIKNPQPPFEPVKNPQPQPPKNEYGQTDGQGGYGENGYENAYGGEYGNTAYGYETGYGGSDYQATEYQGNNQYQQEPCKPSYGTGDWIVSGNQCLGN